MGLLLRYRMEGGMEGVLSVVTEDLGGSRNNPWGAGSGCRNMDWTGAGV